MVEAAGLELAASSLPAYTLPTELCPGAGVSLDACPGAGRAGRLCGGGAGESSACFASSGRPLEKGRSTFAALGGACLLRKEVIQPLVPQRLPCYDFIPITTHTFGGSPAGAPTSGADGFHDVTGGV